MAEKTECRAGARAFPWGMVLIEGIFSLMLGIFLITAPGMTTIFLVTVLGFYWLIRGIFSLVAIFTGETGMHWGWLLFSGILGILAGLLVRSGAFPALCHRKLHDCRRHWGHLLLLPPAQCLS